MSTWNDWYTVVIILKLKSKSPIKLSLICSFVIFEQCFAHARWPSQLPLIRMFVRERVLGFTNIVCNDTVCYYN
jgi:hypothetical protein